MTRAKGDQGAGTLPFRDALADHAHVPALVLHDLAPENPVLTIAIPTFRRPALLAEAVRSAASQCFDRQFEILVVDNDPEAPSLPAMLEIVPDLVSAPVRYVVNVENIGMLGNWNRCIAMARGEWLTILNDDDLLDPDFSKIMLELLARTGANGMVCGKRTLDQRERKPRKRYETALWAVKGAIADAVFCGRQTRPITARQMFWGNPVGNPVGFLSQTKLFREFGGFHPEEYPSADYFFFTRFALSLRVRQVRRVLVSIRVAENESMREDVLYGFLRAEYQIQRALAATVLPGWWARISPWLLGYHVERIEHMWRVALDPDVIQQRVGTRYRPGRHLWLQMLRAMLGGF